jgi:hypothetical protein
VLDDTYCTWKRRNDQTMLHFPTCASSPLRLGDQPRPRFTRQCSRNARMAWTHRSFRSPDKMPCKTRRRRSCGFDRSHELSPELHRVRARIRGPYRFGYRHIVAACNFFPPRRAPRPAFAFEVT